MTQATAIKNKMGHIHIFKGYNRKLHKDGKYNYVDRFFRESPCYLQVDTDISDFEATLNSQQQAKLDNGYKINVFIYDKYFQDETYQRRS
jgi:hypothetical protein